MQTHGGQTDHKVGAHRIGPDRGGFCVWAPACTSMQIEFSDDREPLKLERSDGYFVGTADGLPERTRYQLVLDGELRRPDPASRRQPLGVHGPSALVASDFEWSARCPQRALDEYVIYEVHVGTFTPDGTLDSAVERLDDLVEMGVTAIEVMPVAAFPGTRNWGYDGVHTFAVQESYGGPRALKRFVDACHARELCVVLDVVYNHLGPEGNYLRDFGPYFTAEYRTPWGDALNFDQRQSDHVRRYFIENALQWIDEFRIDALRLDAVQAIGDRTALPFLEELAAAVHDRAQSLNRNVFIIAETAANDPSVVAPPQRGGLGHDAMWADDLHHAIHARLTGERDGYYADHGSVESIARALDTGFSLQGQYSQYRGRRHGRPPDDLEPHRLVVCLQNHDQTGNRTFGERIAELVGKRAQRLGALCVLSAPQMPLLFMGEEYADPAPFQFFVDHSDAELLQAVRQGRVAEFATANFEWAAEPPDPGAPETFERAVLDWDLRTRGEHAAMLRLYADLLATRRMFRGLPHEVSHERDVLFLRRPGYLVVANFGDDAELDLSIDWDIELDTGDPRYTAEPHPARFEDRSLVIPGQSGVVLCARAGR